MEVFYLRDGVRVRGYAYRSYRRGIGGEWMVGDTPLSDIQQITREEWFAAAKEGDPEQDRPL